MVYHRITRDELVAAMQVHGCPAHSDTWTGIVWKRYNTTARERTLVGRMLRHLVAAGRVRRVRPSVYSVGPASRD